MAISHVRMCYSVCTSVNASNLLFLLRFTMNRPLQAVYIYYIYYYTVSFMQEVVLGIVV